MAELFPTIPPWIQLQRPPPVPQPPLWNPIQALIQALSPDRSASAAAAQQPMPGGLPIPRPQATAIPGVAPPVPGPYAQNVGALRAQSQQTPVSLGQVASALAGTPTTPPQMSGPPSAGTVKWGLPAAPAQGATRSFTIGPQPSAGGDPKTAAMSLIMSKEGFRDTPYMDVNALRTGYGSDTVTLPDGTVQPVGKDTRVTKDDALRDLSRRTDEFMQTAKAAIGDEAFSKLTPNQIAALTSITYNYGELPAAVANAVKTGGDVAAAIEGLKGHNKGVNADRRQDEANIFRGTSMPGDLKVESPQLPIPGATTPLKGLPPNAFDQLENLKVRETEPLGTADRITNVLGQMAAAGANAKDLGSFLMAVGAGAGKGATQNINTTREEQQELQRRQDAMDRFKGEIGVRKAEAETQGANYQIDAQNRDAQLMNTVKTEQAKLDTAAKNAVARHQNEIDWQKWKMFQPEIKADKEGVVIVERNPQGGMKVTVQKGNEMDALADRIKDATGAFGTDSNVVQQMKYIGLSQRPDAELQIRRQVLRDAVEGGHLPNMLQTQYKDLEKQVEKGLDLSLRNDAKVWESKKNEAMLNELWRMYAAGQLKDDAILGYMYKAGNPGAALLRQQQ